MDMFLLTFAIYGGMILVACLVFLAEKLTEKRPQGKAENMNEKEVDQNDENPENPANNDVNQKTEENLDEIETIEVIEVS